MSWLMSRLRALRASRLELGAGGERLGQPARANKSTDRAGSPIAEIGCGNAAGPPGVGPPMVDESGRNQVGSRWVAPRTLAPLVTAHEQGRREAAKKL